MQNFNAKGRPKHLNFWHTQDAHKHSHLNGFSISLKRSSLVYVLLSPIKYQQDKSGGAGVRVST